MGDLKVKLSRHLAACSVAAIATCAAVAPDAKAVVIYYEPNAGAGWAIPATNDGLYINVETQATSSTGPVAGWDINPYGASSLTWYRATGTGLLRYPGVTSGPTGNLALGTTVDSSGSYTSASGSVVVGSAPGNWQLDATNYFGFRFLASDNQTHYGWGAMQVGSAISTRTITAIGWEDQAGVAILVGDTGAPVPGPSPASVPGPLPLFGVAAAFSWSRRLRRRTLQASKQPAPATTLTSCKPPA